MTELDKTKPMLPISAVADTLGVHQRTLRIYDDEKILVPNRSPKNRRLYSFDDLERGKFIQYMTRELGINLAGVRIIFELLKEFTHFPEGSELQHIKDIAEKINITPVMQAENRVKLSKRGRKATK